MRLTSSENCGQGKSSTYCGMIFYGMTISGITSEIISDVSMGLYLWDALIRGSMTCVASFAAYPEADAQGSVVSMVCFFHFLMTAAVLVTFTLLLLWYIRPYNRCQSSIVMFPDVELTPPPVFPGKGKLHIPICAIKQLYCPRI